MLFNYVVIDLYKLEIAELIYNQSENFSYLFSNLQPHTKRSYFLKPSIHNKNLKCISTKICNDQPSDIKICLLRFKNKLNKS